MLHKPSFGLLCLDLQLVDPFANNINLIASLLLPLISGPQWLQFIIHVGDGLPGCLESLLAAAVLLAFEGMYFNF